MGLFDIFRIKKNNQTRNTLLAKLKNIARDCTTDRYIRPCGAMCYSPGPDIFRINIKLVKCNICKHRMGMTFKNDYTDIVKKIGQVKKTGIAEIKIVCLDCLISMCKSGDYTYNIKDWRMYESLRESLNKSSNNFSSPEIENLELLKFVSKHPDELMGLGIYYNEAGEKLDFGEVDAYLIFIFKAIEDKKPHLSLVIEDDIECFLACIQDKRTWESLCDSTLLRKDNIEVIKRLTGLKL